MFASHLGGNLLFRADHVIWIKRSGMKTVDCKISNICTYIIIL